MGVRLKPGYPGGQTGVVGGSRSGGASDAPVEDPLNSDWHQQLVIFCEHVCVIADAVLCLLLPIFSLRDCTGR